MTKRSHDATAELSSLPVPAEPASHDDESAAEAGEPHKRPRTFMATLACNNCRARKSRCDEGRPCGYCQASDLVCTYQAPKPTKKDQSMAVAINAIRRLETKIENLTTAVKASKVQQLPVSGTQSNASTPSHHSPLPAADAAVSVFSPAAPSRASIPEAVLSPLSVGTPGTLAPGPGQIINVSFSQHGVASWPAVKELLPPEFLAARAALPRDYFVELETSRPPLPFVSDSGMEQMTDSWLTALPLAAIKGLSDAYFAIFNRNTPVLDVFFYFSSTLSSAVNSEFGYDIETCLVLNVLALGCVAVKAHKEGNFPLPSGSSHMGDMFVRPDWYSLVEDGPPGLRFFNEARKRFGFLMCQHDLPAAQFHMLSTIYYAQILRPIDSWSTVNRASICCISILKRSESIDFEQWEGDMFSRVFWSALMYETIITQEFNLPLSGLLEYEAAMPIPKFTPCPRPKTSISGLLIDDDDDSYFNFHFLAQAAHRILLTRIRNHLFSFAEKPWSPAPSIVTEMRHQLEQWRSNLPGPLQFTDEEEVEDSRTPAQAIARAMLRSRYWIARFHMGRPFLYKALHFPQHMTHSEYGEISDSLRAGMYWPAVLGLCGQMRSAFPVKIGFCSQFFGQLLMFQVIARSPDPKLRATLPQGWQDWVQVMLNFVEDCGRDSPGVAQDAELLKLL
ncbi:hypothetical protein M011DRAFT_470151 [Sporormia fimetaria CBS 119925]|uniref:Zn(2)-C6 fungal-type domain-containing protein n=1 Tax=Sporormia fimetaria CBS 119925 TaxID=1340428 RepID=A0A6A6V2R1_9PLEO|nr:hypothetical protein M011DRAFT_470151 [Sporormia fimetaria CBS 119925]